VAAPEILDNAGRSRFELDVDGDIVFANYRHAGDRVLITHVEAPVHLRGTGAAARLMSGVAALARARGLKLTPLCSYAAAWFRRHRGEADVIA
jgi:predicted GNAT family acetyltransferase